MGNPKLDLKATFSGEGAGQALSLCYEDVTHPGVQSPDRKEAVSTNSQFPRVAVVGRRGRAKLKEARLDKPIHCVSFRPRGHTAEEQGHPNRISSLRPRYLWAISSHTRC